MTAVQPQQLAVAAMLAAVVLGGRELVRARRADAGAPRESPAPTSSFPRRIVSAIACRYDSSSMGRRLAATLWSAQIDLTPTRWRCLQLALALPVATWLIAFGMGTVAADLAGISMTRTGGRLVLRLLRSRARHALDTAAPQLARALATELAAWGSGAQAIAGALRRCTSTPALARALELAAARVALGGDASTSLHRALAQVEPRLTPTSPAVVVAAVFALYRHDAAATAASLDHLAAALEAERSARRDAAAAAGEVRMSAIAVPVIAAATGALLLSSDPAALAAALSFPLLPMLAAAAVIVVLAAVAARRLATP